MIVPAYKDKPKCYGDYPFFNGQAKAERDCFNCAVSDDCSTIFKTRIGHIEVKASTPAYSEPMVPPLPTNSALATQVGGGHYKDMKIQPVEFIHANKIPFVEGCVIKYVSRWRNKNGIDDLKKARHFLDLLIELETRNQ